MTTKQTATVETQSSLKSEGNFQKVEEKTFASHADALSKIEEWRKQHKIPKKDSVDNLFRVRVRLRASGKFDAVLYQKKTAKA